MCVLFLIALLTSDVRSRHVRLSLLKTQHEEWMVKYTNDLSHNTSLVQSQLVQFQHNQVLHHFIDG